MRKKRKNNIKIVLFTIFILFYVSLLFSQSYLEKKEYDQIIKIYEKKDYKRAYQRFKGFIEKYSSTYYLSDVVFYLALLEKNYYSSILLYKELITRFPKYEKADEAYYRLAKLYLLHNNYSESLRTFESLNKEYKKSNYLYGSDYYTGLIYLIKKDYSDSLKFFNRVIKQKKTDKFYILSLIGKANILFEKKKYDQSIDIFKETLNLKDRNYYPSAFFGLGNNYYKLKKYDKAYYYLKRIIKEFPGSSEYELAMEKINFIKDNKTIFDQINWDKYKPEERPLQKQKIDLYSIQIASVKNKRFANDWRIKLKTAGYSTFIKSIKTKEGVFYRTCVGKYEKRSDAEDVLKKIKYDFKLEGTIITIK
ncbi:MAG: tetratricopeptide repeat protein [Spirochaetes bacterium]|nr:tetratricopeptide repeat protein [Spirochaetota bacterium]